MFSWGKISWRSACPQIFDPHENYPLYGTQVDNLHAMFNDGEHHVYLTSLSVVNACGLTNIVANVT